MASRHAILTGQLIRHIVSQMHPKRIVIDTCVLVAALRSRRGASFKIIESIGAGRFRYGLSVPLYLEYESQAVALVHSGKIDPGVADVRAILSALVFYGVHVPIHYSIRPHLRDENDNMVFECAANFSADAIITHNVSDFVGGDLGPYAIDITTPRDLVTDKGVFDHG